MPSIITIENCYQILFGKPVYYMSLDVYRTLDGVYFLYHGSYISIIGLYPKIN